MDLKKQGRDSELISRRNVQTSLSRFYVDEREVDAWNRLPAGVVSQSTVSEFNLFEA